MQDSADSQYLFTNLHLKSLPAIDTYLLIANEGYFIYFFTDLILPEQFP